MNASRTTPNLYKVQKYLTPFWASRNGDGVFNNGRVYLQMIEIVMPCTVDAIVIYTAGVIAGNVRIGLYNAASSDTVTGGTLLASSGSVSLGGATYSAVTVPFTSSVSLTTGQYWLAVAVSSATDEFLWMSQGNLTGVSCYYAQAYAALQATCPAITATDYNFILRLRTT